MEEQQGQAQEQVKATEPQATEQAKPTEIEKRLAELEQKYPKELAGLNKRNSELENKLKALEREKMTEAEKLEAMRKEVEEEKQSAKREKMDFLKLKHLTGAGLPEDFAKRITGESEEDIKADVLTVKAFVESLAHKLSDSEIAKKLGGTAPKGGETGNAKIMTREAFEKMPANERYTFMNAGGKLEG